MANYTLKIPEGYDLRDLLVPIDKFTVAPTPLGSFEFDVPTTHGFLIGSIHDDKGQSYDHPPSVSQFPEAQYGISYPLTLGKPVSPKGVLALNLPHFQSWAQVVNFPSTSAFWYVDVISPLLLGSAAWQAVQSFEAHLLDSYSTTGDQSLLSARLWLNIELNGVFQAVNEIGGAKQKKLKWNDWVKTSSSFTVPIGAKVRNAIIRVTGEWGTKKRPYQGVVLVDHVAVNP